MVLGTQVSVLMKMYGKITSNNNKKHIKSNFCETLLINNITFNNK